MKTNNPRLAHRTVQPLALALVFAATGWAQARDSDVVARSAKGTTTVVAKIRGDSTSCRTLYGLDSWLEWNRSGNSLQLVDGNGRRTATLDASSIKSWAQEWERRLDAQRDAAIKLSQGKEFTAEGRALMAKHADGARHIGSAPARSLVVTPSAGASSVSELSDFHRRIHPVMTELRANLRKADLALEMLSCLVPDVALPADYRHPGTGKSGTVSLVPAPTRAPIQPQSIPSVVPLAELFDRNPKVKGKP